MICANTHPITEWRTSNRQNALAGIRGSFVSSASGLSKMWSEHRARQLYDTLTGIARYEYWKNQSITQRRIIAKYYTICVRCTTTEQWALNHWMPITQGCFPKTFSIKFVLSQYVLCYCSCLRRCLRNFWIFFIQHRIECVTKAINRSAQPKIC